MEASGPAFTIPQQDAFIPTIKIIGAVEGVVTLLAKWQMRASSMLNSLRATPI